MWRWEVVKMRRCEDEKMRRCEDEKMWRWEDVKMRRCEDEKLWRWEDVKMMWRLWRWEDVKMRSCEDEKMRYRPPLLEEPCAQTLSGKIWLGPKNLYRSKKRAPRSKKHASPPLWRSAMQHWRCWRTSSHQLNRRASILTQRGKKSRAPQFTLAVQKKQRDNGHVLLVSHAPVRRVDASVCFGVVCY